MRDLIHRNSVAKLADELFSKVENDQKHGFVSDGMAALSNHRQFFAIVRGHLKHTERAARSMRAFLKKYREI